MGGFQSPLEKDVLRFLLRGKGPVVMALARPMWKAVPRELRGVLDEGRLLVVSPLGSGAGRRVSEASAMARNRWILAHATRLVLGSLDPAGGLARLLKDFPALPRARLDGPPAPPTKSAPSAPPASTPLCFGTGGTGEKTLD